jgi:hypothetical protein
VTGSGSDIIFAGGGSNFIDAGDGDDWLLGDAGNDEVHYQYRSCLRPISLGYSPIRHQKTAKKASPDVSASCGRSCARTKLIIDSTAAYARKTGRQA